MFTDRDYLRSSQYRNAGNLNARIDLHSRFSTNPYGWFPWVFDRLAVPDGSRLLELGCGPGNLWVENAARIPPTWDVNLSDLSGGMLRQARQNLMDWRKGFHFFTADAQAIPFPDASFESVIADHMLYHVPDMRLALGEIRRVLKPGGLLLAATNGLDHMWEIKDLVHRADPQATYSGSDLSFRLENGVELLAPIFSSVEMQRYVDALRVTEAASLVAYILSMASLRGISLDGSRLEAFESSLEQEIAQRGFIHITKSPCLFICWR